MNSIRILGLVALVSASPLLAQDPAPVPAQPPQPAQPMQPPTPAAPSAMPAPAAAPTPAWAPTVTTGMSRRGWFGIQLSCEDCFVQRGPGRVAYAQRPAVNWVESGSPAYQAGLRSGDTLVTVNGSPITTPEGFEAFVNAQPGVAIRFGLQKNGQSREITIIPGNNSNMTTAQDYFNQRLRMAQRNSLQALRNAFRTPIGWLGMGVECEQCSAGSMSRRASWSFRQAPTIWTVDVDGPAHRALLRRGDTLTAIDGLDLTTPEGGRAFAQVEPGQRVVMTYRRAGVERRATLTAVARPDATPEELSAFADYKRYRDSTVAIYKDQMTTNLARLQAEGQQLERMLRELDANRYAMDSAQRRLTTMDSLLRQMRGTDRGRTSGDVGLFVSPPTPPMAYTVAQAQYAEAMAASASARVASTMMNASSYPLRYSGRLKDAANIEVRALGAPSVSEMGDSLVVVSVSGAQVKVQLRQR